MRETVFVVQSVKLCYGELLDKKVEGVFDSLDKATKVKEKLEDNESDFEIFYEITEFKINSVENGKTVKECGL